MFPSSEPRSPRGSRAGALRRGRDGAARRELEGGRAAGAGGDSGGWGTESEQKERCRAQGRRQWTPRGTPGDRDRQGHPSRTDPGWHGARTARTCSPPVPQQQDRDFSPERSDPLQCSPSGSLCVLAQDRRNPVSPNNCFSQISTCSVFIS